MNRRTRDMVLAASLALLAGLYAWWFHADRHLLAVALVFVAPPALLLLGVLAQRAAARFWAGVFALFWFSHGVMRAWTDRPDNAAAWAALLLALLIIALASGRSARARLASRRKPTAH